MNIRRLGFLSLILVASFIVVPTVSAHPLGNFTINHYDEIHVSADKIGLESVLDMAEIPAYQEISLLDKNQDGQVEPEELAGYPERQCAALLTSISLRQNASPVSFTLDRASVRFPPGAGGLSTLRLDCSFTSQAVQVRPGDALSFADHANPDRIGWREIVVNANGVGLKGQYATRSVSQRLTAYPQDMLSSPLDVRTVDLQVGNAGDALAAGGSPAGKSQTASWSAGARSDRFTELITLQEITPASILFALVIAFIWGGLHSLTPGHGKTIVGAYLVGSRGTAYHAVILGLMTTFTHTAGVFLLGLITLFASRYILPDQLFPWISVFSGILVLVIGISLFIARLRGTSLWKSLSQRAGVLGRKTSLQPSPKPASIQLQLASLPVKRFSPPARPAAIGLASQHVRSGETTHTHSDLLPHSHGPGGHTHTHLSPEMDGSKVTWGSLLALGISGGLLPCPSALVVLLGAIALNRIGFGILLVLVFSLGLASVLTGIGLLLVYARKFFDRLPVHSRFAELIPAGSALFITILGFGITWQALVQMGWTL